MIKAQHREFKHIGSWWLDKLPVEWNYASLRWLTKIYAGGTPDKKVERYWNGGTIPWLNSGSVNQGAIETPSAYITQEAFENSSAKWIPAKSLVIALAGQGKTKGIVAQLKHRMTCNQSMAAIVGTEKVINRFVYWWLTSNYENIRNLAGGENRDGLNLEMIGSIFCPLPPNKEQQKIAQFLDYETSKIDALIDEQKRLIELLKEKRQAVISHAVTKGLNPDAPMKDSGVEWLGEVPEHWILCKLKHLSEISGRIGFRGYTTQDLVDEGEGAITLSPSNMVNGKMDFRKRTYISWHKYFESPEIQLTEGDIVLVKTGSTYGRTAFVDKLIEKTTINPQLAIIRTTKMDKKYLFLLLSSEYFKVITKNNNTGGTMPTMTQESVMNITAPNPPLEEQQDIVKKVESSLERFEVLEAEALNGISFLQERRSALISAAVTGKIDVRDWQPPAGSDTVDSNASVQTERHYG